MSFQEIIDNMFRYGMMSRTYPQWSKQRRMNVMLCTMEQPMKPRKSRIAHTLSIDP